MSEICPQCNSIQWSSMDKKYVDLFGICWAEDKIKWEVGELSIEEFEKREAQALKEATDGK